jgi:hypothetical protein
MSNNKQSMKLYTEKQLERAMDLYKRNVSKNRIVESLTPIELPTDEEIENYARQSGLVHPFISRGAKWMRDKIQGGNK